MSTEVEQKTEREIEQEQGIYTIESCFIDYLEKLLEKKVNRKARKLGYDEVSYEILEMWKVEKNKEDPYQPTKIIEYCKVRLTLRDAIKIPGWIFAAKLECMPAGNVICKVPGCVEVKIPERYRSSDPYCDHCKTKRRRNDVFLLKSETTGRFQQVGRQCLQDFTGHSPERVLQIVSWLSSLQKAIVGLGGDDGYDGMAEGYRNYDYYCYDYLIWVAKSIREIGWKSRKDAYYGNGRSTADDAWSTMNNYDNYMKTRSGSKVDPPTEADCKLAKDALEWAADLPDSKTRGNDYLYNICVLAKGEIFGLKKRQDGFVASIIATYNREMERDLKRRDRIDYRGSEFVGTVKKRQDFVVKLISDKCMEGYYGSVSLKKFVDQNDNLIVWWDSTGVEMEKGRTYKIKATVKNHDTYKDVRQTVITRATVLEGVITVEK